jgi:tetratricopeptide (TPR) repeat protein
LTKENVAFLAGGIAFGFVFGFGVFHAVANRPSRPLQAAESQLTAPAGPMAPTQGGPSSSSPSAPMLQEINALKQRLQEKPDDLPALTRLANLYHDASLFDQALGFYARAVELAPADPDLLTDYGTTLQAVGDSERAILQFARAQKANPRHWQSLYNTAVVLGFHMHRYDEAESAIKRVEDIVGPGNPDVAKLREALAADRKRVGA